MKGLRLPLSVHRIWLAACSALLFGLLVTCLAWPGRAQAQIAATVVDVVLPRNLLLITVDDMDAGTPGAFGGSLEGLTPNIDTLATEGIRFHRAHASISSGMPSHAVLMTGLYPHRSGALGYDPIGREIPTLVEALQEAGLMTGLIGNTELVVPSRNRAWDTVIENAELGNGRSPEKFGIAALNFFEEAIARESPFFLMVNIADPHRPFAGSQQEQWRRLGRAAPGKPTFFPQAGTTFQPAEVPVPGFLPDLPEIRLELAQYFASAHRADESVGRVLRALEGAGLKQSTLVVFLSDQGASLPFAKMNCYPQSTRTPLILRWPGVVTPDTVDEAHFVAGIDLAPTVLDIFGLPPFPAVDGQSFVPLLLRNSQPERYFVWTQFNRSSGGREYPMRSILTESYGYIYNAWSDEVTVFRGEPLSGLSMPAITQAANSDATLARRARHFLYRSTEELYDYRTDPHGFTNLINDPVHAGTVSRFRAQMRQLMEETEDPLLNRFDTHLQRNP